MWAIFSDFNLFKCNRNKTWYWRHCWLIAASVTQNLFNKVWDHWSIVNNNYIRANARKTNKSSFNGFKTNLVNACETISLLGEPIYLKKYFIDCLRNLYRPFEDHWCKQLFCRMPTSWDFWVRRLNCDALYNCTIACVTKPFSL